MTYVLVGESRSTVVSVEVPILEKRVSKQGARSLVAGVYRRASEIGPGRGVSQGEKGQSAQAVRVIVLNTR